MRSRPRLLDLYACDGGAAVGYTRAGWEVTGVDVLDRTAYPFPLIVTDATALDPAWIAATFDAVHASPPCQAHSAPTKGTNRGRTDHPDLIPPTRALLEATGLPYVIENVQGSTVRRDVTLCGEMFGLGVIMHRYFELGRWGMAQPAHVPHRGRVRGWRHGRYYDGPYVAAYGDGGGKATVPEMQEAKGITWTFDPWALREMLPPAYTAHLGAAWLEALRAAA